MKAPFEAAVHDAGQFFECATVDDALQSARDVIRLTTENTDCFFACVFRTRKKAGFLSKREYPGMPRKFRCFSFADLFLMFVPPSPLCMFV